MIENLTHFGLEYLIIFIIVFVLSFCGSAFYKSFAIRNRIFSNPNKRSLHQITKPSGGGVVFSLITVIFLFLFGLFEIIKFEHLMILGFGGIIATIFGFVDDIFDISAFIKLCIQIALSFWVIFWIDLNQFQALSWIPLWCLIPIISFLLVWTINLFNFVDGIDGLAASGSILACFSLIISLVILNDFSYLVIILSILLSSCLGFLILNWPPSKMFMGDSGSIFLGYFFGALIIISVSDDSISLWTWIIIFSYFFGDTHSTIIMRIILTKKWYKPHRSHAYQNLARILDSHLKVTKWILVYNVIYVFPLVILSVTLEKWAPVFSVIAILPVFYFSFKYGPKYSID